MTVQHRRDFCNNHNAHSEPLEQRRRLIAAASRAALQRAALSHCIGMDQDNRRRAPSGTAVCCRFSAARLLGYVCVHYGGGVSPQQSARAERRRPYLLTLDNCAFDERDACCTLERLLRGRGCNRKLDLSHTRTARHRPGSHQATFEHRLNSPQPHLHRDWPTPATSAPGLTPRHLRAD